MLPVSLPLGFGRGVESSCRVYGPRDPGRQRFGAFSTRADRGSSEGANRDDDAGGKRQPVAPQVLAAMKEAARRTTPVLESRVR